MALELYLPFVFNQKSKLVLASTEQCSHRSQKGLSFSCQVLQKFTSLVLLIGTCRWMVIRWPRFLKKVGGRYLVQFTEIMWENCAV